MWNVKVDATRCTGCGECVEGCPGEVYEMENGKAVPVHIDECHGCHTCEELCELDAITINED